ncbi:GspE/PulE family protein [Vibrio mangrovi]|uniref:ATPase, T2SS/T4P/T4SS family n=1 Tax=Vibrio mangrovi TaxID=474394 RepID=A0A1Y6IUA3_9VIBR|nr:ATPase, T2SS/T4P/T4SS family [Vibrio mangrovi]MDW6002994.1 ATPase, T2SS/T4P/T4SS family [Vibrio mangrovi]SMS01235.1 Type II secretion system protein E [Vibrio mangrovi]
MSVLLQRLQSEHHLTPEQFTMIDERCRDHSASALPVLLDSQLITARQLADFIAQHFKMRQIDINDHPYTDTCRQLDVSDLMILYLALPITIQNEWLTLAVGDPTIPHLQEDFQFATGLNIDVVVANAEQLQAAIKQYESDYKAGASLPAQNRLDEYVVQEESEYHLTENEQPNDAPVTQFILQLIQEAYQRNASDIHFEPYETTYRIRMRINGLLLTTHTPSNKVSRRLASRLKVLANLNIAERRLPQDGRIKINQLLPTDLDLRISTLPTQWGEKIVLRLLNSHRMKLHPDRLGFSEHQYHAFMQAIQNPQGMILITGPTGSGKTVTLYSALTWLNDDSRNISTVEDPVEIVLSGVNQTQINEKIGLTFSHILRAMLRQDPDILMIGEIRDPETADIAFRAAQTGHLVLSTLHTNSAREALTRLLQMGLEPYHVLPTIRLIVAQRLLRKLCPRCKIAAEPAQELVHHWPIFNKGHLYQASVQGCHACVAGYQGRFSIFELLLPEQLSDLKQVHSYNLPGRGTQSAEYHATDRLWYEGLNSVHLGITSYEEVVRVLGSPSSHSTMSASDEHHTSQEGKA